MIEERNEIPLEELDKRVAPGMYMLMRTGGYHPYHQLKLEPGDEDYKKPIWPYVKKLQGYHQHLNAGGKMNGSISTSFGGQCCFPFLSPSLAWFLGTPLPTFWRIYLFERPIF